MQEEVESNNPCNFSLGKFILNIKYIYKSFGICRLWILKYKCCFSSVLVISLKTKKNRNQYSLFLFFKFHCVPVIAVKKKKM